MIEFTDEEWINCSPKGGYKRFINDPVSSFMITTLTEDIPGIGGFSTDYFEVFLHFIPSYVF